MGYKKMQDKVQGPHLLNETTAEKHLNPEKGVTSQRLKALSSQEFK